MRDHVDRTANILILAQKLIEELDEFEGVSVFRHQLKQTGKAFKQELEKSVNTVYGACESTAVLEIHDVGSKILDEISKLSIEEKHEFLKHLPQQIENLKQTA